MHRIIMFVPIIAALIFTGTGTDLGGVVFSDDNIEFLLGQSSGGANDFLHGIAVIFGVDKMSRGQVGTLFLLTPMYCLAFGFAICMILRDDPLGPWINAAAALFGSLAVLALWARFAGPFSPQKPILLAAVVVAGSFFGLLGVWLLQKFAGDPQEDLLAPHRSDNAGDRLAAIAARKRG